MFSKINSFFEKKKERKTTKDSFARARNSIREFQTELENICFYLTSHYKDQLPEQSIEFMQKAEFALTSLQSCLGIAQDNIIKNKVEEKLKEKTSNG